MSSRQGFLVNNPNPGKVTGTGIDVREDAVRIMCTGLGLPGAAWQVQVGIGASATWQNVVRFGVPIVLSDNNTQYVEIVSGTYRVAPVTLPGAAQVWFQEDETTDRDSKTVYVFGQENTNQNGITGNSTDTIDMSGNGTVSAPLRLDVNISDDADNQLVAHTDGLYVPKTFITAGTGITVTGSGTQADPYVISTGA